MDSGEAVVVQAVLRYTTRVSKRVCLLLQIIRIPPRLAAITGVTCPGATVPDLRTPN